MTKKRNIAVSVQLPADLWKQARHTAIERHMPTSTLVEHALSMFLRPCERVLEEEDDTPDPEPEI